jgi:GTP cyclohydrolase I
LSSCARSRSSRCACTAWLQQQLEPKGVGVVLEAEHLCMSLRGVQTPGAKTVTSALDGLVRDGPRTREEFLTLTHGRA